VIIAGELLARLALLPSEYVVVGIRTLSPQSGDERFPPIVLLEIEGPRIPPIDAADPFADLPTIQLRYRHAAACRHPELESMEGLEPELPP
jgi:hypothetical protein